jgi:hypothetical protein
MAFCPNCGKENPKDATECASCGKELAPGAKEKTAAKMAKFKGTILMPGASATKSPLAGIPEKPPPAQKPADAAQQPPAGPAAQQPRADAPPQESDIALQKTMLGTGGAIPGIGQPADAPPTGATPEPAAEQQAPEAEQAPPAPAAPPKPAFSPKGTMLGQAPPMMRPDLAQPPGGPAAPTAPEPVAPAGESAASGGEPAAMPEAAISPPAPQAAPPYGGPPPVGAVPTPETAPSSDKNRIWLWVAIGCLGILALICVGTGITVYFAKEKVGDTLGGFAVGTMVIGSLAEIQTACSAGDCKQAAGLFHPEVRKKLLKKADKLTPTALAALVDVEKTSFESLEDSDYEKHATSLGLEPDSCVLLSRGGAKVIGCGAPDGTAQIIHMENLESLK